MRPTISVVVPTWNRFEPLQRLIESVLPQLTPGSDELIVVDDASTDRTRTMQSDETMEIVHLQTNVGAAGARNVGIDRARGEVIIFVDDDCIALPNFVNAHRTAHRASADPAFGPMVAPSSASLSPWCSWEQRHIEQHQERLANGQEAPTWRNFFTGNASVRRSDLEKVGGFDTSLRRGEDIELARRLETDNTSRFRFLTDAVVHHLPVRTLQSWENAAVDYAILDVELAQADGAPLDSVRSSPDFRRRHALIRFAVEMSLLVPLLGRTSIGVCHQLLRVAEHFGQSADAIASVAFNLRYFLAMAAEIAERPHNQLPVPETRRVARK